MLWARCTSGTLNCTRTTRKMSEDGTLGRVPDPGGWPESSPDSCGCGVAATTCTNRLADRSEVWSESAATVRMTPGMWPACTVPKLPVVEIEPPTAMSFSDCDDVPAVTSRQVTPVNGWVPVLTMVTV